MVFCYNVFMAEKETEKAYENITSKNISDGIQSVADTKSSQERKSNVRTFAKDAAEQMKTNSASVVKIALAEQNREREYETIVKSSKKQQILFLVFAFIFFVGGSLFLGFALRNNTEPVPLTKPVQQEKANSIVFSEQQDLVDVTGLTRAEVISIILEKADFVREAGITNLITTTKEGNQVRVLQGGEFMASLATNIPQTLLPLLTKDFMIGIDGDNEFSLFIILSFQSFDSVVNIMREWEAFFVQDMSRLFSIQTEGQLEIFSRPFESEILFNKESRVLRDKNQGFVVGYTFLDRQNLVISTNVNTIREVVERYTIQAIN